MKRSIEEIKESIAISSSECIARIDEIELKLKKDLRDIRDTIHRSETDAYTWLDEVHKE